MQSTGTIHLTLPHDASKREAYKALALAVLQEDPCVKKAARQIGVHRDTLAADLESWGYKRVWVHAETGVALKPSSQSPSVAKAVTPPPSTLNPQPSTSLPALNPQPSTLNRSNDLLEPGVRAKLEALKARRGKPKK